MIANEAYNSAGIKTSAELWNSDLERRVLRQQGGMQFDPSPLNDQQ